MVLEFWQARTVRQVQLLEVEIRYLCNASREIFLQQPNLLKLEAPIKICGTCTKKSERKAKRQSLEGAIFNVLPSQTEKDSKTPKALELVQKFMLLSLGAGVAGRLIFSNANSGPQAFMTIVQIIVGSLDIFFILQVGTM